LPIKRESFLIAKKTSIIAHIDMNAFFASVEQRNNPSLRGRPVAVCGTGKRTIISAASYEAKAYGVKTGMPPGQALKICPGLILVTGSGRKYIDTSAKIMALFKNFSPTVEVASIDEAFLDLTTSAAPSFHEAKKTARCIKEAVLYETGLTCSVGIACNKLLAKLGSDLQKPDGLVIITPEESAALLETLPVGKLCGIGPSTTAVLRLMGIRTCGQLGKYPLYLLRRRFGALGEKLHLMGLGLDYSPVIPLERSPKAKSFGHSVTLSRDTSDIGLLSGYLLQLSQAVGRRLRADAACGSVLTLMVRYTDFSITSRQKKLYTPVSHSLDIFNIARDILLNLKPHLPVRLLGVTLSGINRTEQLSLFSMENKRYAVQQVMDDINNRYGDKTVRWGAAAGSTPCRIPVLSLCTVKQ
jgi:DNA polymerase-4